MDAEYAAALDWLYARQGLGIKLGLDKVHRLLAALGDPHHAFHAIHVAGTNGKGSVVRMLESILAEAGYAVGATTSPHLIDFRERITVGGEPCTAREVADGVARIQPIAATLDDVGEPPTFFECVTALAFLVFRERGVQWAVVETGMGGRLDATNVLSPIVSVITDVALDHAAFLGDTIADVAWEKAGIMKSATPCVTSASGDALTILKARSHALGIPMSIVGEDYHAEPDAGGFTLHHPAGAGRYALPLAGAHQVRNAALAVATCDALERVGVHIDPPAVQRGLARVRHPGRLEALAAPGGTPVLLDGAHNVAAAEALADHLRGGPGFDLVVGFCADKPWQAVLDRWAPLARRVWAVPIRNPRSLDPADIVAHVGGNAGAATDPGAAIRAAEADGATRIVVAGSLFLVGEARALLTGQPVEGIRGNQ